MKARRRSWIAFYALNWLVIGLFWFLGSGASLLSGSPSAMLLSLGRLVGLAGAYTVLTQVFLMSRFPWLERQFGLDKLALFHHKNGRVALPLILIHPVLIVLGYSSLTKNGFIEQAITVVTELDYVLPAFIAVCLLVIVVVSSLYIVRKHLKYENWYFVHLLVYVAILFSFRHQIELGDDLLSSDLFYAYWVGLYVVVLLTHIISRFGLPIINLLKHRFVIDKVEKEAGDVHSVYITGRNMDRFRVVPGQFMILRFLQKGFWYEAHPFSLSRVPEGGEIRITIKNVGDFTRKIKDLKPGTRVLIEGGYGVFTDHEDVRKKVLMIAGGIGITPIRSLSEEMLKAGKEVALLYGNRTEGDAVFKAELEELEERYPFSVVHILSEEEDYLGEKGYIDEEKITRLVPDVLEREVYVCGPVIMMDKIIPILKKIGVPSDRIHFERFSLHG